ncbi:MAG: UrcA family protein [Sphingomonas sp.]|uniref:UrcA family protein n=1 Tax=Sphingomonas sp. TaxID=28214 RepID=UPI001AC49D62|nr:UrcA family protein [Sphingomonas sp.]MBN8808734.1 UrcA family protein [Sphingomonas sp.]
MTRPFFPPAALPAMLVAGMAVLAPATASAHDRDVATRVVSIRDLDLSSTWGMDRTIHRLRNAIDTMCDDDEDCRDEAWLSADWQVARAAADAGWRRRIAEERDADRLRYRWQPPVPPAGDWGAPPPPPSADDMVPPPPPPPQPPAPVASVTTTTTTTTTTTVTLVYRQPPPDYGWYPH